MKNVDIRVFLIGGTTVDHEQVKRWMEHLGVPLGKVPGTFDPSPFGSHYGEQLVRLCGKRCYMSFIPKMNRNVQRVRNDMESFINNILEVGHGSVLEHANYNFAIEGVSRVFTGEMNRHRAGTAISEGSMRFIRYDDLPYWLPTCIRQVSDEKEVMAAMVSAESRKQWNDLETKKQDTRDVFAQVFDFVEQKYSELEDIWKEELAEDSKFTLKKQLTSMMRRIIPMGVATGGIWSGNLRALRHIFTMRCDSAAEEEILLVASLMLERMIETEPQVFKDFHKDDQGYWRPKYRKV